MKSYKRFISRQGRINYGLIFLIIPLCLLIFSINIASADINAPVIIGIESGFSENKPLFKGTTESGTLVHIYINGIYNGKTEVTFHESGTANFSYEPFLNLSSGNHTAWAIAEDEAGNKSKLSNVLKFNIEPGVPAPTLFQPAINISDIGRPYIVGLSKNDLTIKVFIDNELDGEYKVENHESGTASFTYQTSKELARGQHLVYAVAKDSQNKESRQSNTVSFKVADPSIAESVNEEDTALENEQGITDEDINKLIGEGLNEESGAKSEEEKSKWSPSLIIFILFFAGVIGWIIWVNRELIKERRKQIKKDTNQEDNK
jgi:hypothetical protein